MSIQLNEENSGKVLAVHVSGKLAMATFCKPFTKARVRYFNHAAAAEARGVRLPI